MIELGKKYRTRDGREARVYAVDSPGKYPVVGVYCLGDGRWHAAAWTRDGGYIESSLGIKDDHDLIEVLPEVTVRREVYIDDDTIMTAPAGEKLSSVPHLGQIEVTHNGKEITDVKVVK